MLDVKQAWQYSTGAGVTVALIDTGVTPNPRFPGAVRRRRLCDGAGQRRADRLREPRHRGGLDHRRGTVQPGGRPTPRPAGAARHRRPSRANPAPTSAATAAAEAHDGDRDRTAATTAPPSRRRRRPRPPRPGDPAVQQPLVPGPPPGAPDGIVGVAPDAALISIRQSSVAFGPARPTPTSRSGAPQGRRHPRRWPGAIRHAADLGVKVINVSWRRASTPPRR